MKQKLLAEREGFEPPLPFRADLISSQAPPTGLGHLSAFVELNDNVVEISTALKIFKHKIEILRI